MGQTLSEPVVEKDSDHGEDDRMAYGVSSMQGWRITMEDAHATVLQLTEPPAGEKSPRISFFGVYDGHGGNKVAIYSGKNVHEIVAKQDSYKAGDYSQALMDGFLATDRAILGDARYADEMSGCTACVSLIVDNKVYVANAGDSRGVLGIRGRAKPMSEDHKPQLEGEKARITAAGGFVDYGRVNGNLALSRAIGDFQFKKSADLPPEKQIVTALPEVEVHELTDDDEFLVLACDGIWDCQSSQSVVEFVRRGIAARQSLDYICENMMDNCLASSSEAGGIGCDNMTMMIIAFLGNRTREEWYDEIGRRVAAGDGPCAPPEFAESRGPGIHHNFDDKDVVYDDLENKSGAFSINNYSGRVIFLDGADFNSNGEESIFDSTDEEKDLKSQIPKDDAEEESSQDSKPKTTESKESIEEKK